METSKFKVFTQEKYDELYAQLKDGTIKVGNDQTAEDATGVPTEVVKVEADQIRNFTIFIPNRTS